MSQVFLDTSGLVAVANRKDRWHARAEQTWKEFLEHGRQLVTTNVVLIELGDGLSRLKQRPVALRIREMLMTTASIIQLSSATEEAAWNLFAERHDKEWGLTDCISMTVMSEMKITQAFTLDHHFQQAGFQILPDGDH